MTIEFNVTGPDRKKLVGAISTALGEDAKYKGAPTFAYEVGEYRIDKTGTVTGPDDRDLIAALAEHHGFVAIIGEYDDDTADDTEPGTVGEDGPQSSDIHEPGVVGTDEFPDIDQHHPGQYANPDAPMTEGMLRQIEEWAEGPPDTDTLSIDIPLEGFTPENIDNLCKLVGSKEVLIKKALGAEALPIQVLEDRICFAWFKPGTQSEHLPAYAAFITHLAETAKNKKRVTAKAQESFENEKFAMRVWLIGLGLIGKEFNLTRKLLMANLGGNSSWRYGAPEQRDAAPNGAAARDDRATGAATTDTILSEEPDTDPTEAATGEEAAPVSDEAAPVEESASEAEVQGDE